MAAAVAGLFYPFVVYALIGYVPAGLFILIALAIVAIRVLSLRRHSAGRKLLPVLLLVGGVTAGLALLDRTVAAKAYPVVMSLAMALAFGRSLLVPPSLIEIFASVRQPEPSHAARLYMRRVSGIWCGFLIVNAGLSLATAASGSLALWTLYNGLLSYLLMGALFGGEWLLRQQIRRREQGAV